VRLKGGKDMEEEKQETVISLILLGILVNVLILS
jgi:hypothetical protein